MPIRLWTLLTIFIDKGKGRATDTPNNVQHVTLGMFSTDVSDH